MALRAGYKSWGEYFNMIDYTAKHFLPVVGRLEQDETANVLGTGYMQFDNKPLHMMGLCKPIPGGISILAVATDCPGRGHFREFVRQLQFYFARVEFLVDLNPVVSQALFRYGFVRICKIDSDGSRIRGWEWIKT